MLKPSYETLKPKKLKHKESTALTERVKTP